MADISDSNHPSSLLSNILYNSLGLPRAETLGNNVSETLGYDTRMRMTSLMATSPTAVGATLGTGTVTIGGSEGSRQVSATTATGFAYTYDADGNRVEKSTGTTGILYWYMSPGIVIETDLGGNLHSEYVFFDGERIARKDFPGNAVSYYFADHLKTADVVTDSQGNITNELDIYPWGGELPIVAGDSNDYIFTGKKRDPETGLDYFGARYYSNGLGRFVTPDWSATPIPVPYVDFTDPQTLNLYGYAKNLPTTAGDLDGHCGEALKGSQPCSFNRRRGEAFEGGLKTIYNDLVRPPVNFAIGILNFGELIESNKIPSVPEAQLSTPNQRRGAAEMAFAFQMMPLAELEIDSVWDLGPARRGFAIENLLGANLPNGFPVVDRFVDGVATSIKSIDLNAASYQSGNALANKIDGYVDP